MIKFFNFCNSYFKVYLYYCLNGDYVLRGTSKNLATPTGENPSRLHGNRLCVNFD